MNANQHHVLTRPAVAALEAKLAVGLVDAAASIGRRQKLAIAVAETFDRGGLETTAAERAQLARLSRVGAVDVGQIEPVCGQVGLFASV